MTELLSPPEAARLIGVNVHQVKEWIGNIPKPLTILNTCLIVDHVQ